MKKRILSLVLALTLFLALSGCSCKHEWLDATCTTPATCAKCGEAAGSPLGHSWKDATCTQPQTCSVCGATNGQPLGHQWLPATCVASETCSVCGETQGDAPLGHTLNENGTCTVCGEAVGTPLNMGNYTQYLNFFIDYGTPQMEKISNSRYYAFIWIDLSSTPDSRWTYHNVKVTYKLTSNFSNWTQPNKTASLDELGRFSLLIGAKNTWNYKAYSLDGDGSAHVYSYSTSNFKRIDFTLDVIDITGYVIPAETDTQNN